MDESQAGIKIARRNINNLRCADDTTLMAEIKQKLKRLLIRVKEESEKDEVKEESEKDEGERGEEKPGLKFNIQKTKIMAFSPITSCQIEGEKLEAVTGVTFLGPKITMDGDSSHEIEIHLLLGRKAMTNLDCISKSWDIILLTTVHIFKAMVFSVVMYRCESWTVKKAECQRIDAFKLWC